MAKAKATQKTVVSTATWRRLHKIEVHHNRWLAWTIAIAILTCATLVAYIQVSGIHFETQMSFNSAVTQNWGTFTNRYDGYTVKYPRTWAVESEGTSNISFVSTRNVNEYFSITSYDLSEEKSIRTSLFSTKEDTVKVSGVEGTKLSQSRNQPENVVMVKDSSRLYVIRGKGEMFDKVLSTFKFQQKLERV
jgi:hypothetical protein